MVGLTMVCSYTAAKLKILLKLVVSLSFLLHVGFIGFNHLTRRLLFNIEDYVRYVHLIFANNTKFTAFKNFLQFNFNYPNNCAKLDIKNISSLRGLRRLKVRFEEVPNSDFKVEIRIEDREKTTDRSNSFARFSFTGPFIMLASLNQSSIR